LEERRRALDSEIDSIQSFLNEHTVRARAALTERMQELRSEAESAAFQLRELDTLMRARSDFGEDLRRQYKEIAAASNQASVVVRDRETLLRRLLPLSGQYAEDERQLIFYEEAKRLFDPLRVATCPACLQPLPEAVTISDGACSLCGQDLIPSDDEIDVKAEIGAVRVRRRAIEVYIGEVEAALSEARATYERAVAAEREAQRQLDAQVAESLAPFVAARDGLVRRDEAIRAELVTLQQQEAWHDGLERRGAERARLDREMDAVRNELRVHQSQQPSRDAVVQGLSGRFRSILADFGFPKLDDPEMPYLDNDFVPHVRGNPYRAIGSSGGLTLISLAWMLTIFERAIEEARPHPGFLLIDSPQKNLSPRDGQAGDEFRDPAIALRVWNHILRWSSERGRYRQLIVVDNSPPPEAESAVVVRYTGRPEQPPYGLIDDEVS
jgi:hypothetical protein